MATSPAKQTIDYELATSYRRSIARLIDFAAGFLVLLTISLMLSQLLISLFKLDSSIISGLFPIIWLILLLIYDTLMHRYLGKTLGKILLGLRVVDLKGEKLSWGMSILRAFITYLVAIGIIFLTAITASIFGWIFIGSLGRYRRFPQDAATRSFVVREIKGLLVKATGAQVAPSGKPTPLADLERLYEQGLITKDELDRKKTEIGAH